MVFIHYVFPAVSEANQTSRFRFITAAILLFFVLTVASAAIYYFDQKARQAAVSANIKSIAVLPFKTIGEGVEKEKLGLGMADAVISRLSKLQQIVVRPTSAVFRYTDQPAGAVHAGQELGVDAVLEGTTQCDGERVRVSVQLVRVADGKSLWAESFQEKIFDIFVVQDSISAKVALALSINLTKQQEKLLEQRTTNSAEAFQAYQPGIYFINKRTKEDLLKAVEYFQQAVNTDSNYAQAYAGLADSFKRKIIKIETQQSNLDCSPHRYSECVYIKSTANFSRPLIFTNQKCLSGFENTCSFLK